MYLSLSLLEAILEEIYYFKPLYLSVSLLCPSWQLKILANAENDSVS